MIEDILEAYLAIYRLGDDGLDALSGCPTYMKWLEEGEMEEGYLEDMDESDLELLLDELEDVIVELDYGL
jgi:hypothetical protein